LIYLYIILLGGSSILRKPLYISDVEKEAIDAIKAKMAADPSYNPMSDPQAVAALDSLISPEVISHDSQYINIIVFN